MPQTDGAQDSPTLGLEMLRKEIDKTDQQILLLLKQRFFLADQIATIKSALNEPAYQPKRIAEIMLNLANSATRLGLPVSPIQAIWSIVIEETTKRQSN